MACAIIFFVEKLQNYRRLTENQWALAMLERLIRKRKIWEAAMARIYVEPAKVRRSAQDELDLARELDALSREVSQIRSNLRYKIAGREQISARLQETAEQIAKEAASTRGISSGLQQILTQYEQTENNNRDQLVADEAKTEIS